MAETPMDQVMKTVAWRVVPPPANNPDGLPYATHEGELEFVGVTMKAYALSNGERIFTEESVMRLLSLMNEPGPA